MLKVAAGLGLEPRYSGPKPDVLPLDDPAMESSNVTRLLVILQQNRRFTTPKYLYARYFHLEEDRKLIVYALLRCLFRVVLWQYADEIQLTIDVSLIGRVLLRLEYHIS